MYDIYVYIMLYTYKTVCVWNEEMIFIKQMFHFPF